MLRPTRRSLLQMAAAAPLVTLPATRTMAELAAPGAPNPGHTRFAFGDARITVISDGHLELPMENFGVNADEAARADFLERYFLSAETNYAHTNHTLIELGDVKLLVDIGSGDRFMPTAGRLMDNLDAAGIDPATITHLAVTHAHPDHVWGIRDDFDEGRLPDAEKIMGQSEHDWWMQDGLASQVPAEMQQFVVGAQNSIQTEGVAWTLVSGETDIAPGIRMIDTPGHTLGHMSLVVESGGSELLIAGDALNHAYMNFAHPGWVNGFDMDADLTVSTRQRLLDRAAADRMAVMAYHFPFPGIGHVTRMQDAYTFVPALVRWEG